MVADEKSVSHGVVPELGLFTRCAVRQHTPEQRCCLYCTFVQVGVRGHTSTKLARCLAESQGLCALTKPKKLLIALWLVHRVTLLS